MLRPITLLGATGSIGRQTLDVVAAHPDRFRVFGFAFDANVKTALPLVKKWQPRVVAVRDAAAAEKLSQTFTGEILRGEDAAAKLAARRGAGLVVAAIAGTAGLASTLAALENGHDVALANKESLVLAGEAVLRAAKKSGARIFPVDSEHSGVWQLLAGARQNEIRRVILTASGGALRDVPLAKLPTATADDVLAHPTWQMGAKITVDCATLANKAFELIEAHHLFGLPYEKLTAVLHRESTVHALVELTDGSVLAQLAAPDMRLPIELALLGGRHAARPAIARLDFSQALSLHFAPIDHARYPLFQTILTAAARGQAAVAALAAERAAELFLAGQLQFAAQTEFVKKVLKDVSLRGGVTVEKLGKLKAQIAVVKI